MPIRITGLNSGLDTEAIISALMSSYQAKTDKYKKAQTKLSWKQDAWKSLNIKINKLYKTASNLRFTSGYSLKKTTVSDPTKATITTDNKALNGSQKLKITQTATSGYLTGGKITGATGGSASVASLLGLGDGDTMSGTYRIAGNGKSQDITITEKTTINDFISQLNNSGTGVNASYDATNQRIFISSTATGKDADFTLTALNENGAKALNALGVNTQSDTANAEAGKWLDAYYDGTTIDVAKLTSDAQALADAKNEINDKQTRNSTLNAGIDYLNARKAKEDVEASGYSANDRKVIMQLAGQSEEALSKTSYKTDTAGNYLLDSDGKLQIADDTVPASDKRTGADILNSVARDDLKKEVDDGKGGTKKVVDTSSSLYQEMRAYDSNVTKVNDYETANAGDEFVTKANTANALADYTAERDANNADIKTASDTVNALKTIDTGLITKEMSTAGTGVTSDVIDALTERVQFFADNYEKTADGKYQMKTSSAYYADPNDVNGAKRVNGQDAAIELNGAQFTSATNKFNINGLSIEAHAVTTEDLTITTATDTQGIYDKIKDFLSDYNDVINEMTTLYNAASSKGYEPLTADEKEALSDKEVEEWEQKIKDSLLRRDDTLGGLITAMTSAMSSSFNVGGKNISLASLGIKTLGYFDTNAMERNALHIDGDEDDEDTSGKTNTLMSMLNSDPDKVIDLFKQVTSKLYDNLDKKMRSTRLRTAYTVYNDKEMAQSYSDYTKTISKWEEKIQKIEDSYYKKFAAMEKALASINSQSSAFSGFFG